MSLDNIDSGLAADRPGPQPASVDKMYRATDTGVVSIQTDDSTWTNAFTIGGGGGGGGGQDLSEIALSHPDGPINGIPSGGGEVSDPGYNWLNELAGGAFASWNPVTNRLVALQAGRYRATWNVTVDCNPSGSGVAVEVDVYIGIFNGIVIGSSAFNSQSFASTANSYTASGSKVIDLVDNDELTVTVFSGVSSGTAALTVIVDPTSSGTYVQLEYLGPTPA